MMYVHFASEYILSCLAQTFDHILRQGCPNEEIKGFTTVESQKNYIIPLSSLIGDLECCL